MQGKPTSLNQLGLAKSSSLLGRLMMCQGSSTSGGPKVRRQWGEMKLWLPISHLFCLLTPRRRKYRENLFLHVQDGKHETFLLKPQHAMVLYLDATWLPRPHRWWWILPDLSQKCCTWPCGKGQLSAVERAADRAVVTDPVCGWGLADGGAYIQPSAMLLPSRGGWQRLLMSLAALSVPHSRSCMEFLPLPSGLRKRKKGKKKKKIIRLTLKKQFGKYVA